MAEEPEQVLPQHRPTVRGREHQRAQVPVGQQRHQRRGEDRERQQDQDAGDQRRPGEDRHPEHRHPRRPQAHDRGDEVDPTQDRAQTADGQAGDPQVTTGTRAVGDVGQRGVGEPSEVRGTTGGREPRDHDQAAEQEQPERERVQPRECHIRGTQLQRQDQVGEREEQRRREEQQHHRAVHGEQLVVLLIRQELQPRPGQLTTHQHGHQATDHEPRERHSQVHQADRLVISGPQQHRQPRTLLGHVHRTGTAHDRSGGDRHGRESSRWCRRPCGGPGVPRRASSGRSGAVPQRWADRTAMRQEIRFARALVAKQPGLP
ncbi:unannotated protein [freshwater metagenome]|uniref:Unannotated protein n=1 Tax=freshwater metagenome TaxID=449393 RepID=A0A6J7HYU2_9ZZZZ